MGGGDTSIDAGMYIYESHGVVPNVCIVLIMEFILYSDWHYYQM